MGICWYLERYHDIQISTGGVYGVLKRNGLNLFPKISRPRSVITHRYEKQMPGHHIQVDVKFLKFKDKAGRNIKRFRYTAIDDATRIRALKIYQRHTQKNAIDFINYVNKKIPFRIHIVRTDNGHEFQSKFHWYVVDLGINHVYIKPKSPHLKGKVERSHSTDDEEFYQLFSYKDDVDLEKSLLLGRHFIIYGDPIVLTQGRLPMKL